MMVLVDTSVWSLALRRTPQDLAPVQKQQVRNLQELISEGRVQLLGVVRQELLSGIRRPAQFARLREHLRAFSDVLLDREDYEQAAEMNNACRAMGLTGGVTDFLICAVAARRKWDIYTADRDFERFGKHLPLTLYH